MWLNSVLLDTQLQFRRPQRRETSAAWGGFHQPQKEPAVLQPLPNKFSKLAAGTEPFFRSYTEVLECKVPPGKQRSGWCKLINRETVWTDVTSSPESRFDDEKGKKKGLGFEESKEGSSVQALLLYSRFYLGLLNWWYSVHRLDPRLLMEAIY